MAKYKRKQFFINKELQGKYMLSFAVPMVSLLVFFALLFYFALTQALDGSLKLLYQDVNEQITFSLEGKQAPSPAEYESALSSVKGTIKGFAENDGKNEAITQLLVLIILPGFFLLMIQVLLLTIFFSHKLAGPVYRLEIAMNRVLAGDYTEKVTLRDGDQLKNLAELFNEVVETAGTTMRSLTEATSEEEKRKIIEKVNLPLDS